MTQHRRDSLKQLLMQLQARCAQRDCVLLQRRKIPHDSHLLGQAGPCRWRACWRQRTIELYLRCCVSVLTALREPRRAGRAVSWGQTAASQTVVIYKCVLQKGWHRIKTTTGCALCAN